MKKTPSPPACWAKFPNNPVTFSNTNLIASLSLAETSMFREMFSSPVELKDILFLLLLADILVSIEFIFVEIQTLDFSFSNICIFNVVYVYLVSLLLTILAEKL